MLEIVVIQCPPIRIENANRICKQISHFNVNVISKWSNFRYEKISIIIRINNFKK